MERLILSLLLLLSGLGQPAGNNFFGGNGNKSSR